MIVPIVENKHKRHNDPTVEPILRELKRVYGADETVEHREDLFRPERKVAPLPVEISRERIRQQIANGGRPVRHI